MGKGIVMKENVIIATYDDLVSARNAVTELVENNFKRSDIGLAVKNDADTADDPGSTLVTVTISRDEENRAMQTLEAYGPTLTDRRDVQWRMLGWTEVVPNEETFTAVER